MKRAHVYLPETLLAWLKAEAERRGTNVSEVLRAVVQDKVDGK
jgi:hypothetical protein